MKVLYKRHSVVIYYCVILISLHVRIQRLCIDFNLDFNDQMHYHIVYTIHL